ncbi:hypothetical protein [Flavivirga spongiicola]|uniref:DUF2721 domain-containing protein n=1 Tax=Flavivirga spongiicola TaxID=421621 RepID=A0ABU7XTK8_9FLAO|nr:hypothetical protein [Flavivirga sp. MEBiC05379]MDO5978182.1 hypothetical protein [Flavivirga sp. MEBiC05379]
MNWYLPIKIIPRLGMLILSTVTQMLNLSSEINNLMTRKCSVFQHEISKHKIKQLSLLTRTNSLLCLTTGSYVLSVIFWRIFESESIVSISNITLYTGIVFVFMAITLLITYAFKAVKIRKDRLANNQNLHS